MDNTKKRKTILLIDDEPTMHKLARTFLEKAGYNYQWALGGQEGLKKILEEKPDLILLDYMMPDMDGDQVYSELISNEKYRSCRDIPVIILTAKESDFFAKSKFLEEGVSAYLNKPFGLWELKNVIENVFISNEIRLKNRQLQRETERKAYELSMLQQIGLAMQETLELEPLLHLILTCTTAGCALGFSRAMLLLINKEKNCLEGAMGVGPSSQEEANRIWEALAQEKISLSDFLEKYGKRAPDATDIFNNLTKKISIPLDQEGCLITRTIREKKANKIFKGAHLCATCTAFCKELEAPEFIVVPLITKDRVIGAVVADNMYSNHPIEMNMIQLLTLFANQAALAIERADAYQRLGEKKNKLEQAYKKLQETQERLLHAERLATTGKMAAHVAHEIRNPLVTIGGFARSILKSIDQDNNKADLKLTAQIITEEVRRLENILANVLDFTRLAKPNFQREDINRIVTESCLLVRDEILAKNINITKSLDTSIAPIFMDPQQIKQVLLNILQNALYSMPNGGELYISTQQLNQEEVKVEIRDTGVGMSPEVLENMFNPFFTTKPTGTGLGLAITQQIIHSHGGKINVQSQVGVGTTFSFTLPLHQASELVN
ncbi:MAG: ATP-binding protein [candidate division KSB1 bacterium]|nr:ATP-binding protein [candidate division KSB1 bacterium]